ncbi:MAG: hypothetical protein AAF449_00745 [Myxococcota bacterium]
MATATHTTFDLSEIMKEAWANFRAWKERGSNGSFSDALRFAWMDAKATVRQAKLHATEAGRELLSLRAAQEADRYRSARYGVNYERAARIRSLEMELAS